MKMKAITAGIMWEIQKALGHEQPSRFRLTRRTMQA
jgi:hypothetical protein